MKISLNGEEDEKGRSKFPYTPMRILVRGVNWIGDGVMSIPTISGIKKLFPESEVYLLANPQVSALFKGAPYLSGIIEYDKAGVHKGIVGFFRLIKTLRGYDFDLAILLQNAFEAAFIAFCAGIKYRAGYPTDMRGALLNIKSQLKPDLYTCHQVYYYLNILEDLIKKGIGIKCKLDPVPRLLLTNTEIKKAHEKFREITGFGENNKLLVGINPGASYGSAKKWRADRFAEVADAVISKYNANILVFGGPKDTEAAGEVFLHIKQKENAFDLSGRTTIKETMALINSCSLFITNDSGPMHIASAFDVPVVAIFGSTDIKTTYPFGTKRRLIKKDIECSPCLERECKKNDHACMESITSQEVIEIIEEVLSQ